MRVSRVFRHSDVRQAAFAGLEFPEVFALLFLFLVLLLLDRDAFFVHLMGVGGVYLLIRFAKRGKPEGFSTALFRYSIRALSGRLILSAGADWLGRANPFNPIAEECELHN